MNSKTIVLPDTGLRAVVDLDDYERLSKYEWFTYRVSKDHVYAATGSSKNLMHRMIMNEPENMFIDHKNHETLDNRKSNLRIVTNTQNQWNQKSRKGSSDFKGVCWLSREKKWQSKIMVNGKRVYLGSFVSEIEAAKAYDKAAKMYFGEYAWLNFKDLNYWVDLSHSVAVQHGWWDSPRPSLECHMLMVSEIAEATEEYRKGKPPIYIGENGKPEGEAIELADVLLRIFDYFGAKGWDLEKTVRLKHEYNKTRPYRHGNKIA
jgi:hypothetical protein